MDKIDKQGMYKVYDRWPVLAQQAWESDLEPVDFDNIDHIVFAGMGGSGAIGDIFSSILSKENIHVCVVKGYHLPRTVDEKTLVVTTSISGNTVETLTVLEAASKSRCKVIGFSSGGKLESFCKNNQVAYRKIPMVHSPRASFVVFLYSMLRVLEPIIPVGKNDVTESICKLHDLEKKISSTNMTINNDSLMMANWLEGIPLIYYPFGLQAAAIRFKNSLQENAKLHAMAEDVIEACHNGIVSWERPTNVRPILIQGQDDYSKTKERWKILKQYLEEHKINYWEIKSAEGNILLKLINLIYAVDFASIYKALLSGIDPSPVRSIYYIKERL